LTAGRPLTRFRVTLALMLVMVAVLLAAGCTEQSGKEKSVGDLHPNVTSSVDSITANTTKTTPSQQPIIATERKVYPVVRGEPFTYRGLVNDTNVHSVSYLVNAPDGLSVSPTSIPVNANGAFAFTISGEYTQQAWNNFLEGKQRYKRSSPYYHVCINYSVRTECFDLQFVESENNTAQSTQTRWIQIDPLPDITIRPEERGNYTGPFFINGTTNLPEGEILSIELISSCYSMPCPPWSAYNHAIGCCGDGMYKDITKVQNDASGINRWSVLVNTTPTKISITTINGAIDDYNSLEVYVSSTKRTTDENGWDLADFVVRVQGLS
jgi:hypothetical protein